LPASIGNLQQLKFLGLNRNRITTLPPEAGRLKRLEVLELWDNEIDSLPDDIRFMSSLRTLELRGILFSEQEQSYIRSLLPDTDILFSPSCHCKD
jgi:Leucine-rich repeat (LRR) protein